MKIISKLVAAACVLALLPASLAPATAAPASDPAFKNLPSGFDMQAHRGGRGENLESSLPAFRHAIKLGVTTLELDIVLTKDGVPVVWHDITLQKSKCRDTKPVTADDPLYPYAGKPLGMLTWKQAQTVRCDKRLEDYPEQKAAPGNKLITLGQVFKLAKQMKAKSMYFNIETKTLPLFTVMTTPTITSTPFCGNAESRSAGSRNYSVFRLAHPCPSSQTEQEYPHLHAAECREVELHSDQPRHRTG